MDLQLLPYIVVTNPHIKRVYDCYFHAFNELRTFPPVCSLGDNERFSSVLRRLVDEHGGWVVGQGRGCKFQHPATTSDCRASALSPHADRPRPCRPSAGRGTVLSAAATS